MERKLQHALRVRGGKPGQQPWQPCAPARSCSTSRPRASCGRCRPAAAARARAGRGRGAWSRAARASSRSACSAAAAARSAPAACRTRRTGRRARPGRAQAPRSRCQHSMRRREGAPELTPLRPFRTGTRRLVIAHRQATSCVPEHARQQAAGHAQAQIAPCSRRCASRQQLHASHKSSKPKSKGSCRRQARQQEHGAPCACVCAAQLAAVRAVACYLSPAHRQACGASLAKTGSAAAARCGGGRAVCVPTRGPRLWLSHERGLLGVARMQAGANASRARGRPGRGHGRTSYAQNGQVPVTKRSARNLPAASLYSCWFSRSASRPPRSRLPKIAWRGRAGR